MYEGITNCMTYRWQTTHRDHDSSLPVCTYNAIKTDSASPPPLLHITTTTYHQHHPTRHPLSHNLPVQPSAINPTNTHRLTHLPPPSAVPIHTHIQDFLISAPHSPAPGHQGLGPPSSTVGGVPARGRRSADGSMLPYVIHWALMRCGHST